MILARDLFVNVFLNSFPYASFTSSSTDATESRIMKTSDGYEQCNNAQAAVSEEMLILGAYANNCPVDSNELIPALESIPDELGKPEAIMADSGYCSVKNIEKCAEAEVEAYLATGRQTHNRPLEERLEDARAPDPAPEAAPFEQMKKKLRTAQGKAAYRLRKMTAETVFGIIKEIMGFRRFLLRGEEQANGE